MTAQLDATIDLRPWIREYRPMPPELPERQPRTLLQIVHERLLTGGRVTLSLGISIPPIHPSERTCWTPRDTAALLLALQMDMGAVPEPTFEEIREAWVSRESAPFGD
jgi:hypothetical protein